MKKNFLIFSVLVFIVSIANGELIASWGNGSAMPYVLGIGMTNYPSFQIKKEKYPAAAMTLEVWCVPGTLTGDPNQIKGNDYRRIVEKGDFYRQHHDFSLFFYDMVPIFRFMPQETMTMEGLQVKNHCLYMGEDGQEEVPVEECLHAIPYHWNHVVAVFDNGKVTTYLNGQMVAWVNTPSKELPWNAERNFPVRIGSLNGMISRLNIYNNAFSAEDVERHYLDGLAEHPEDMVVFKEEQVDLMPAEYSSSFEDKLPITREFEENLPATLSEPNTSYDIVMNNGEPMVMHNGEIFPFLISCVSAARSNVKGEQFEAVRDWAAAGFDITGLGIPVFESPEPERDADGMYSWFVGPDQYDWTTVDKHFHDLIEKNPRARFFIRIQASMPRWWCNSHKNEAGRTFDDKTDRFQPSYNSPAWRRDCPRMLTDLVQHLENSDYAFRIAGYVIGGGRCCEWYWFGTDRGLVDYSDCNIKAFREWLRKKYHTEEALKDAWGKDVSFDSAMIPSPEQRNVSEMGLFRDWSKSRDVMDYRFFQDDTVADCIELLAETMKKALPVNKLVGTFYGYTLWHTQLELQGFHALYRALQCPNLDFFISPVSYDRRRGGMEGDYLTGYTASLRLHEKMYVDEADLRTCFSMEHSEYKTPTFQETIDVDWRTLGNALTQGASIQYLLLSGVWSFHYEPLMRHFQRTAEIYRENINHPRRSTAEVALIMDERSIRFVNDGQKLLPDYLRRVKMELGHAGVPYDTYLLSDIGNPEMKDYKLYIFPNTWWLGEFPQQMIETIHEKLARNNATAIWFYAPGFISYDGGDTDLTEALTGFRLRFQNSVFSGKLAVTVENMLTSDVNSGENYEMNPMFEVTNGTVCATLEDRPSLSTTEGPWGGTSIYCLTRPTKELLRGAARLAGCHVWNETGDLIRANEGFLMIHATGQGNREIRLPRVMVLKNLFDDTVVKTDFISIPDMHNGQTVIWRIEQE